MSNIFAKYKSGDNFQSDSKVYKVSEIIDRPFMIVSANRLEKTNSQFSEGPSYIVNAMMKETGEEFIFFAQQKVLFDKIAFLLSAVVEENVSLTSLTFLIKKTPTKDGKSFYYDIVDFSETSL